MPALFSDDWMVDFGNAWNDEKDLGDALAKIGFNSTIGYGFEGETKPRGYHQGRERLCHLGRRLCRTAAELGFARQPRRLGEVVRPTASA